MSQVCELLLRSGVDDYDKEGHSFFQKILMRGRRDATKGE